MPQADSESRRKDSRVVAALLRDRRGDLTRAELRVAQALLRDYPAAGLQPIAGLAAASGVSGPTVVRLFAKLGYASYSHLQRQLRSELSARTSGPVQLYPPPGHDSTARRQLLVRLERHLSHAVADTLRSVDENDLERAVTLLSDRTRPVLLTGGRASIAHAYYMATYLQLLRPGVSFLGLGRAPRTAALLDVDRAHVLVVFDFHRYERETVEFGRAAAARGGTLILFTDTYLSPLASSADVLLTAAVDGLRPFITLTPVLALVETTTMSVAERIGPDGRDRLADFDELNSGSV
ncbi:MAG TPA: MurR/RpiR family transcriptional regulator [Steroidobacteraceae bacterium]